MPKRNGSSTWTWWVTGALAAALAVGLPHYLRLSDQREETPPPQQVGYEWNKPSGNQAVQATTRIGHARHPVPAAQSREIGAHGVKLLHGDSQPLSIDPEEVYQALMSLDPAERDQALETASRSAETLYAFNAVYKRIVELNSEDDPQVAERAQYARSRMVALRAVHEIAEPPEPDADEAWQNDAGMTGSQDVLETAVEPFDTLRGRALDDPDPAVRLGGIEAAMSQRDEDSFDLLSEAARGDYEPDNRLTAVSELEQMLKSGLGDREQILQLLEKTAADPDSRVAELSQLIIQEQFAR
jgi:hypothetical protein